MVSCISQFALSCMLAVLEKLPAHREFSKFTAAHNSNFVKETYQDYFALYMFTI